MLLANQLVARQLVKVIRPFALLRRHPSPVLERAKKIMLICRSQKLTLNMQTSRDLNESLMAMKDKYFNGVSGVEIMDRLLMSPMQRAEYFIVEDTKEEHWAHWALNFPIYTHFTSPIRRYADVIVHRLLQYTLSMNNDNNTNINDVTITDGEKELYKIISKRCNERHKQASDAELDSQKVHLCLILDEHPIVVDAIIIDMCATAFEMVVPGLGFEISIKLRDIEDAAATVLFELPDSVLVIDWKTGEKEEFKLFSKICVRLSARMRTPIRLETTIIHPSMRNQVKVITIQTKNNANKEYPSFKSKEEMLESLQKEQQHMENLGNNIFMREMSPVADTIQKQMSIGDESYYTPYYD